MKSHFFSTFDITRDEDLCKDIAEFVNIPEDTLRLFAEKYESFDILPSSKEKRDWLESLLHDHPDSDPGKMQHVADVFSFFCTSFREEALAKNDSPSLLVDDLIDSHLLDDGLRTLMVDLLSILHSKVVAIDKERRKSSHNDKCIPWIRAVDVAVDFRAVFESDFEFTDDPEAFVTKCEGVSPLAVVSLTLSKGNKDRLLFQADKRSLLILINYLKVAIKQMEMGQEFLGIE